MNPATILWLQTRLAKSLVEKLWVISHVWDLGDTTYYVVCNRRPTVDEVIELFLEIRRDDLAIDHLWIEKFGPKTIGVINGT